MNRLNDSGRVFLTHTRVKDMFVLRLAVGNIRTERRHVEHAWQAIRAATRELDGGTT